MGKESFEIKIGIFVAIGVVLLVLMIVTFGQVELFRNDYKLTCFFKGKGSVGDVSPGVAVRFRGLRIGSASDVSLTSDGTVKVVLRIHKRFGIKKDARVRVIQTSILGESYFQVDPGSAEEEYAPKDGSAVLQGITQPTLDEIVRKHEPDITKLISGLNSAVTNIDKVVGDKESQQYFKDSLRNTSLTMEKGPEIAANIASFIKNGTELAKKMRESAATFDQQVTELGGSYIRLGKQLNDIADKLNGILDSMQAISEKSSPDSTVARLISEDQLYRKLVETLDEAKLTLAQIKRTVKYLEENPSVMFWGGKKKQTEEKAWWQRLFSKEKPESQEKSGKSSKEGEP